MEALTLTESQTITSREIAEITSKRHSHVKRDIENAEPAYLEVFGDASKFGLISYKDSMNRNKTEYSLNKSQSLFIASGYSPVLRAKIQKRFEELESKNLPPDFSSPALAARAWADQYERREIAEFKVLEMGPKVEYHDKVISTSNGLRTTEIASELGLNARDLNRLLQEMKIQRKVNNRWVLTTKYLNKGYTIESTFFVSDKFTAHSLMWTEKGRKFIHESVNDKNWE